MESCSSSSICLSASNSSISSDCSQDCGPPKPEACKPKAKPKKKACGSKGKCAKPGKVTRNPFLNFLRDFRKQNCGKSMIKISKEAGAAWRKMKDSDKEKYRQMACSAPKSRRRHKKHKSKRKGCKRL